MRVKIVLVCVRVLAGNLMRTPDGKIVILDFGECQGLSRVLRAPASGSMSACCHPLLKLRTAPSPRRRGQFC